MTQAHGARYRLTFRAWLYQQRNARNAAIRDIANALMADGCLWSGNARSLSSYRDHLLAAHQASAAALEALRTAYEQYQREVGHVR